MLWFVTERLNPVKWGDLAQIEVNFRFSVPVAHFRSRGSWATEFNHAHFVHFLSCVRVSGILLPVLRLPVRGILSSQVYGHFIHFWSYFFHFRSHFRYYTSFLWSISPPDISNHNLMNPKRCNSTSGIDIKSLTSQWDGSKQRKSIGHHMNIKMSGSGSGIRWPLDHLRPFSLSLFLGAISDYYENWGRYLLHWLTMSNGLVALAQRVLLLTHVSSANTKTTREESRMLCVFTSFMTTGPLSVPFPDLYCCYCWWQLS